MIKTNLPLGLAQERNDDGTIRLTMFADIIYDHGHLEVVAQLINAFHNVARALCTHAKWEWRKGSKWCLDCEQWIPAFPPEDAVKVEVEDPKDSAARLTQDCACAHWVWVGGKRHCSDCGKELAGHQSPELDDVCKHPAWERKVGKLVCQDCGLVDPCHTIQGAQAMCKHDLWEWRAGKKKGTSIRFCSDCRAELPYDEEEVKQHNPFIHHCGDPDCRQCGEYRKRDIGD